MTDSKWVVIIVVCALSAITIQNLFVQREVLALKHNVTRSNEQYQKDLEDVYFLMKSDSSKLYTIMDTEIRILHYTKPHKEPMWCCPECDSVRKKTSEEGGRNEEKSSK